MSDENNLLDPVPISSTPVADAALPETPQNLKSKNPSSKKMNPLALVLGLSAVFFGAFLLFSFIYFFMKGGNAWKESEKKSALFQQHNGEYIAVIELNGVIMDSKRILKQIHSAVEDKDIKGIVMRLNSPGGAVAPSQEIYEAVKRSTKPVYSSMSSVAASGAYYVAAGTKKVYANAGTLTGSIGVIMEFMNLKKLYEWAKVERFSIKTGKFKDSGADYREMSKEERDYFDALVQDTLVQFKMAVKEGRGLTETETDQVADGRVFTGVQAKVLKLVDEIGTLEDCMSALAKELKFKGKPKIVRPVKRVKGLQELLLGGNSDDDEGFEEEGSGTENQSLMDRFVDKIVSRITGLSPQSETLRSPGLYWIWNGAR